MERGRSRRVVLICALAVFLARFPSLLWPLRADEAGLVLVARAWDPQPDSLYGTYWVDRPPVLLGLVGAADWLAGPFALRLLAALGLSAMVLCAAAAGRSMARISGVPERADRVAAWCAVAAAGLAASGALEPLAAKSEVLGIPFVMAGVAAALRALERSSPSWAALAGLSGMLAVGMKQNLVGALAFGGVLLVGCLVTRRLSGRTTGLLAIAALAGAAVPVVGVLGWAQLTGVDLATVWYQIYGFRGDATRVLAAQPQVDDPGRRALLLAVTFVGTGMAALLAWFLLGARAAARRHGPLCWAVTAMLLVDVFGVLVSGSFWQAYLLVLVPPLALAAGLASLGSPGWRRLPPLVGAWIVGSTVLALLAWTGNVVLGTFPPTETYSGRALARSAHPQDTAVVFGGRSDLLYASGLDSPYQYLWTLPMRVRDPDMAEFRALVSGDRPPTWVVEWVGFTDWNLPGSGQLQRAVRQHYRPAGENCRGNPVWLLKGVRRPAVRVDCDQPPHPGWWFGP